MKESNSHFEERYTPEITSKGTIHLELGRHYTKRNDMLGVYERFKSGDLTASYWDKNVAKGIKNHKPKIIGIDGQTPFVSLLPREDQGGYQMGDKVWTWLGLPVKADDDDPLGDVLVVKGDANNLNNLRPAVSHLLSGDVEDILFEKIGAFEKKQGNKSFTFNDPYITGPLLLALIGGGAYAGMYGTDQALESLLPDTPASVRPEGNTKRITRRSMLKHTLYAAGSVIGGAAAAKVGYDYIPVRERRITYSGDDNELKKFTTSVLTGDVTDHVVLDGRTAIMISKAQETAKYFDLPLESVAVVAGSGHRHNAQMYLENADARKYAIKRMAERFVEVINTGLPHENHALREITHNALFNYLTRTEAYLAKDPGIAKTDKPEEIVDKNVNYFFGFDCDEVMEAIAHLREANVCKDLIF